LRWIFGFGFSEKGYDFYAFVRLGWVAFTAFFVFVLVALMRILFVGVMSFFASLLYLDSHERSLQVGSLSFCVSMKRRSCILSFI